MKIDLSEVNKSTKVSSKSSQKTEKKPTRASNFKLTNPLKKQRGPARDHEGKFTSGSGGLLAGKKLNWKRMLPIVLVISLAGGFLVFRSFAAGANGTFVTEMYQRCYNTMKSSGSDYDFWKKKLDSGTSRNTVWAQFVAATGKACSYPYPPASTVASTSSAKPANSTAKVPTAATGTTAGASTTSAPTTSKPTGTSAASMTAAQVKALYQKILDRDPSQSETDYWVDRSKTWTAAQIEAHLKQSNEGFRTNIAAKLTEAQAWKTLADAHVTNAKTYNDQTYKLSTQTVVSKENLDTISQRVGSVRSAIGQVNGGLSTINDSSQKAAAISAAEASQFQAIARSLASSLQQLNGYLKNIENDYARANKTYEANIGFFAQIADAQREQANCRAGGGTPTLTGGCNYPPRTSPANPRPADGATPATRPIETSPDAPQDEGGPTLGERLETERQKCLSQTGRSETKKIDGGRTTQKRYLTYQWKNLKCVESWSGWQTVSTTSSGPAASRLTQPWCSSVSNTNLKSKRCMDGKRMNPYKKVGGTHYFNGYWSCIKQFGTLRSCTYTKGNFYSTSLF